MKLRTIALALALAVGAPSVPAFAATKTVKHKVPKRKSRASTVKKRKFKKTVPKHK